MEIDARPKAKRGKERLMAEQREKEREKEKREREKERNKERKRRERKRNGAFIYFLLFSRHFTKGSCVHTRF